MWTIRKSYQHNQYQSIVIRVSFGRTGFAVARSPRGFAKTGNNASRDPPDDNSNDTQASLLGDGSGRRRNVNEVVQLNTVENGVSDADVREVHAEGSAVDTWPSPVCLAA